MSNFNVEKGDLVKVDWSTASQLSMIAALVAIDAANPGTLQWVMRQVALAMGNWNMSSSVSDPAESIKDQQTLIDWLRWFDKLEPKDQDAYTNPSNY
jgi:hypothetical protein